MTTTRVRPVAQILFGAVDRVQGAVRNYASYRETYNALNALPTETLLDFDMYRGDLKQIARRAVYR